jgi:hypothetical protein
MHACEKPDSSLHRSAPRRLSTHDAGEKGSTFEEALLNVAAVNLAQ